MKTILIATAIAMALAFVAITSPAHANSLSVDCQGSRWAVSCQLRSIGATLPHWEYSQARDAAWVSRCQPTIVIGADGIHRYVYAAPAAKRQGLTLERETW